MYTKFHQNRTIELPYITEVFCMKTSFDLDNNKSYVVLHTIIFNSKPYSTTRIRTIEGYKNLKGISFWFNTLKP